MKSQNAHSRGFTLVETLVAISMLVTTIVAPLTIAADSLFQSRYARDQVIATYLAQETVEMVRYVRDKNLMEATININNPANYWLNGIWLESSDDKWIYLDWASIRNSTAYYLCDNPDDPKSCPYLNYNGIYTNQNVGDRTKFKRAVKITRNADNLDEIKIESRVYWQTGGNNLKYITITSFLYNWTN